MSEITISINNIRPSDSPSRSSWERSRNVTSSYRATLYLVAGHYMAADGNHRIARLYQRHGGNLQLNASVEEMTDPLDVRGFLKQIKDIQDMGIYSYGDFLSMCVAGNFDRD